VAKEEEKKEANSSPISSDTSVTHKDSDLPRLIYSHGTHPLHSLASKFRLAQKQRKPLTCTQLVLRTNVTSRVLLRKTVVDE
jgi:hypothetical protein